MSTRICSICKSEKELSEFPNNGEGINRKDGRLRKTCKECNTERVRQWRGRDGNNEKWKESMRKYNLFRKFKISPDEYDAMYEKQNGVCAVCGGKMPNGNRLAVDHNHNTGKVRGLLCVKCNRALGLVGDNPAILRKLADYLELSDSI